MLVTTTAARQHRRITGHPGIVAGEAIPGARVLRDPGASVRDVGRESAGTGSTPAATACGTAVQVA